MNKYYTAQEVAEKLKVKKTTVYELIKRGELPSSKMGKQLRISEEQLDSYLKRGVDVPAFGSHGPESSILKRDYLLNSTGFIISGQTCPALELLCGLLQHNEYEFPYLHSHMNTYNSLYSLYFGKVHIAMAAGLEIEEIQMMAPGVPLELLSLYDCREGFFVEKGNPTGFQKITDLKHSPLRFANREKGSARRMRLDRLLKDNGISSDDVAGYDKEYVSDMAAIGAVSRNVADVTLGEEISLLQYPNLEFLPLRQCSVYLVYPQSLTSHRGLQLLKNTVRSFDFKEGLENLTGYNTARTGAYINI